MSPALPTLAVIGAMKCATSALHDYLDAHPDVAMSRPKELDFFSGLTWDRGISWYAAHFDPDAPARGESSPGYTSPDFPGTADRMADVVPDVRLLYLVREPLHRALSQYAHHRADGTERRPVEEALLDPDSQYVARSRYAERLRPFLERFPRGQVLVVVQERLGRHREAEMSRVHAHVGVDPDHDGHRAAGVVNRGGRKPAASTRLRREFAARVDDDVERLRELTGDDLPEWSDA